MEAVFGSASRDVGRSLATVLTQTDIDHGQGEGCSLHDAAAGVAEQETSVLQKAPVGHGAEVDEDMRVSMLADKFVSALHQTVAAGVGVGIAEDDLAFDLSERGEERVCLLCGVLQQSYRMIGHDGWRRLEVDVECLLQFRSGQQLAACEVIERGGPGTMDPPGLFAHADDAGSCCIGGCEVNVRHLGESVADGVVDGAFADLSAFDVRHGDAQGESDAGGGEHLVAVRDQQQQVGAYLRERVGKAKHGQPQGLGHADVGVRIEQALDARGNDETILFDLVDGVTEGRGEVRCKDNELQGRHRDGRRDL